MFTAFSKALTALQANTVGLDVIGNNLANLNTPGFKASVTQFHELMAESLGGIAGTAEVGLGTGRPKAVRQFTQGAIQLTGGNLDAAIEGPGFFMVKRNPADQANLLTRAGNFQVDREGNLLTATGEFVQGWVAKNGVLDTGGAIQSIVLPLGQLSNASATTKITLDANLNAAEANGGSFSTPVEVVDSLGKSHVLTINFTKTAENSWDYQITIPGEDLTDGTAGTPFNIEGASGSITFDDQGRLLTPEAAPGAISFTVAGLKNAAADMQISWSLYTDSGTPRLTQYSAPSASSSVTQNGLAAGQVTRIAMADDGVIMAYYSNRGAQPVARLALAAISNPESLIGVGDNNFIEGPDTAAGLPGIAGTPLRGRVVGGALESSTADIAREFTNLIVMQRSYQANAKVITATDELSQETLNMKR